MEPRTAATRVPDPDAVEFIRFCYRRRRVGWPELYDEMCAVAARGQFRGYSPDDLSALGIGFGLFDLPALAALASQVIEQERASRRPVSVTLVDDVVAVPVEPAPVAIPIVVAEPVSADVEAHIFVAASDVAVVAEPVERPTPAPEPTLSPEPRVRFAMTPARA